MVFLYHFPVINDYFISFKSTCTIFSKQFSIFQIDYKVIHREIRIIYVCTHIIKRHRKYIVCLDTNCSKHTMKKRFNDQSFPFYQSLFSSLTCVMFDIKTEPMNKNHPLNHKIFMILFRSLLLHTKESFVLMNILQCAYLLSISNL